MRRYTFTVSVTFSVPEEYFCPHNCFYEDEPKEFCCAEVNGEKGPGWCENSCDNYFFDRLRDYLEPVKPDICTADREKRELNRLTTLEYTNIEREEDDD